MKQTIKTITPKHTTGTPPTPASYTPENLSTSDLLPHLTNLKHQYTHPQMTDAQLHALTQTITEANHQRRRSQKRAAARRFTASIAAALALFILLPNTSPTIAYAMSSIPVVGRLVDAVIFRTYHYESERQTADIDTPALVPGGISGTDAAIQNNIEKTTDQINREIASITDQLIAEFKQSLETQDGYQNVLVKHEILATTGDYFTLKLICYQGAGSGAEWDTYYTIDLGTGKRLALGDLFQDGADYLTPISESIKAQMRAQMDADPEVTYWLDDPEIPEWNFTQITDDTSFYLNQDGQLVICFNEGDVAPMSMGCVEFEIPGDAIAQVRK